VANVFISYERSAEAIARDVIEALDKHGHETWSDALIPPHQDYADSIQEHLQAAEVVVVLWSQSAAASQWVRAEADYARENNKLVQVILDESTPPMPFNRIQCARLRGWTGNQNDPEWLKVLHSIEQLSAGSVERAMKAPINARVEPARSKRFGRLVWVFSGVATIAAVAGALWFARDQFHDAAPPKDVRVAVLPFDTLNSGEEARYFADGLTDRILTTLSNNHIQMVSRGDAATLRGPEREARVAALGVALLFDGTVRSDGDKIDVNVHLEDPRQHVVLWSKQVNGTAADGAQLQARIADMILNVLATSKRALHPSNGLADPTLLVRYLHAWDLFSNSPKGLDPRAQLEFLGALREVTVHAPEFAAAHADLAFFDAIFAAGSPPEQAVGMRQEAADEARRALELDPKSPLAYAAQAWLLPMTQWAQRERLLREGIAADPGVQGNYGLLAYVLADVGRLTEAVQLMRQQTAADRVVDWSGEGARFEAAAGGQTAPCIEAYSRDGDYVDWFRLLTCQIWAGHWDAVQAMLAAPSALTAGTRMGEALKVYAVAARTRTPADRAVARSLALSAAADNGGSNFGSFLSLARLGYIDDAFVLAENYTPYEPVWPADLFFFDMAPLHRDPRFMKLAARIGLVDYWTTSGHWPDFCSMPGLPYDCRKEAARLATQ
jgi:TolB-like protein